MDEQEFKNRVDEALDDLYRRLSKAAEQHDFEADFNSGALAIEFESPPAKFVVSPNAPVRQVWVSAHMKSFKLDWDPARNALLPQPAKNRTLPVCSRAACTGSTSEKYGSSRHTPLVAP